MFFQSLQIKWHVSIGLQQCTHITPQWPLKTLLVYHIHLHNQIESLSGCQLFEAHYNQHRNLHQSKQFWGNDSTQGESIYPWKYPIQDKESRMSYGLRKPMELRSHDQMYKRTRERLLECHQNCSNIHYWNVIMIQDRLQLVTDLRCLTSERSTCVHHARLF